MNGWNTKPLKDSEWKAALQYIQPDFLLQMWEVLRMWAEKYKPMSWVWVDTELHYASAMRHLLAWKKWELVDKESWLSHLIHAACNLHFIHYNEKK